MMKQNYKESKFSSKEEEIKHRQGFSKDRSWNKNKKGKVPTDFWVDKSNIQYCQQCNRHTLVCGELYSFHYLCCDCMHDKMMPFLKE